MKNALKQSNLPFLLLIGLLLKSVLISSPIFDGVAVLALSTLFGFKLWLDHIKKPDHNQLLRDHVDRMFDEHQKQINKVHEKYDKQNDELSEKISSVGANVALQQKRNNQTNKQFHW